MIYEGVEIWLAHRVVSARGKAVCSRNMCLHVGSLNCRGEE